MALILRLRRKCEAMPLNSRRQNSIRMRVCNLTCWSSQPVSFFSNLNY